MKDTKVQIAFNALAFQAAWWACVIGVMQGMPLAGPLAMMLFLLINHLWISRNSEELQMVLAVGIFGTAIDTMLFGGGLIRYEGGYGSALIAPLWISAMWMGFAATIHHALAWMKKSVWLGFSMGAVFGPLSYWTGHNFGVLNFEQPLLSTLTVLALIWGLTIPLLYKLSSTMGADPDSIAEFESEIPIPGRPENLYDPVNRKPSFISEFEGA